MNHWVINRTFGSVRSILYIFFIGLGGGYNERENVEYIEREESDDEYDDVSINEL